MNKVSVIVPTYNRAQLLVERALPSLSRQTYGNLEILVVGDGTDQATVDAMAAYADPRVKFWNLPHFELPEDHYGAWCLQGLSARNFGLDQATGEYIAMLDDDDEMLPSAIEHLLAALHERNVDFVYGISETFKEGRPIGQRYGAWPPGGGSLCQGAYVYRRELGYRYDLTCVDRGITGDADLWERMFAAGVKFSILAEVVHYYHRQFP